MLNLTRWNPLEELTSLHREMDRVFGRSCGEYPARKGWSWVPATEITSGKGEWKVRMALPGIDPTDVHVDLNYNVLTITGERTVKTKQTEQQISEIGYGRFAAKLHAPRVPGHREGERLFRQRDA